VTTGIVARVFSVDGTALIVDNTKGGKLLSGRANGVEMFSVSGSGNVTAKSFTGDGSGLTGIPSSAGGTVTNVGTGLGLT
jgi:hypothetical protein